MQIPLANVIDLRTNIGVHASKVKQVKQTLLFPPPPKVDGGCVFTRLFVCEQDISKSCGRIQTKF